MCRKGGVLFRNLQKTHFVKKSKGMLQIEVQDYYLIGPKENPRNIYDEI